jgi:uncharacterized membrane-anchored protein
MKKPLLFSLIILGQLAYLGTSIGYHQVQIRAGTRILLKTAPVDPFSMFRGRYVALRYDISRIPITLIKDADPKKLKPSDTVYVALAQKDAFWEPVSAHIQRPSNGTFLRGRLRSSVYGDELQLLYGLESFFLSEASADEIEGNLRQVARTQGRQHPPLHVEVAVARDGTGYPIKLLWQGREYR